MAASSRAADPFRARNRRPQNVSAHRARRTRLARPTGELWMSLVERYVGQASRQAPQWTQASSVSLTLRLRETSSQIPARTSHGILPVPGGVGTFSFNLARSSGFAQNGLMEEVSPSGNGVTSAIGRHLPPGERVTGTEERFSAATGKLGPVTVGLNSEVTTWAILPYGT